MSGSTGFLGIRLVREFVTRGDVVTLLYRQGGESAIGRVSRGLRRLSVSGDLIERFRRTAHEVEVTLIRPKLGLSEARARALAEGTDVFWHAAGDIDLNGDARVVRPVNVDGTRHFLDVAALNSRKAPFVHVSTAFVAGARRTGHVWESDLSDAYGFENAYEHSKYDAEVLVRAWSRARDRAALILRPSVLLTDQPPVLGMPRHPFQVTASLLWNGSVQRGFDRIRIPYGLRPQVRLVGRDDAHLNCLPVDDAAKIMIGIAALPVPDGVSTYHVVHPGDTPVHTLIEFMERFAPVRFRLVPEPPERPTPLETQFRHFPGLTPYVNQTRTFDDSNTRKVAGVTTPTTVMNVEYLLAGVGDGGPA
ncbi:SDR family oxidoreductase [Streptomyces sp. NPDC005876]|uniref:SDR family oxidoreductase n=1 Tax=unclassified Streptomyces TaxID=2593676 RepID=UPI0033C555AF